MDPAEVRRANLTRKTLTADFLVPKKNRCEINHIYLHNLLYIKKNSFEWVEVITKFEGQTIKFHASKFQMWVI